ncbi:MAG: CIA30 family protein [Pseudomonadota bacterium]
MANAGDLPITFADFSTGDTGNWTYVADGVMGGVSQGTAAHVDDAIRLRGNVSTENNGGFIQVRSRFEEAWPAEASELQLEVKGNGEPYYVFLRTRGLTRPWYSYRASFLAPDDWSIVALPLSEFVAARPEMPQSFTPDEVISIGLVAYGRDHAADLSLRRVEVH